MVVAAFRRHTLLPPDDCLMRFKLRSRTRPDQRLIAACGAMAYRV